jgi:hypothetical protein
MDKLKTWLGRWRPSFRVYFLISMACIALRMSTWFFLIAFFGYALFETLDEWIVRFRRDEAHDYIMDIFEPDPDDPQKEVKSEWYWERLSKSEATDSDFREGCGSFRSSRRGGWVWPKSRIRDPVPAPFPADP